MKKVLITGITGQDGSYMAEYCLEQGCEVYGMVRRTSTPNEENFKHLRSNPKFHVVNGDLLDGSSINNLVSSIRPDYFINLAAQSFVGVSWQIPEETFMVDAVGVLKCLEAIKNHAPHCRFYNAGSSEEFGDVITAPQDESHPLRPRSPYGAAKCAARHLVKVYRESYGLYAVQGLLFNHESERRGEEFVTRKITKGVARIAGAIKNKQPFEPIRLGNIYSKRDWSHAKDFVDGIWKMLNQEACNPEAINWGGVRGFLKTEKEIVDNIKEYVLASGETHTIKEFIDKAFFYGGFEGSTAWVGEGLEKRLIISPYLTDYIDLQNLVLVEIDPAFYRPAEVELLLGDPTKVKTELKWEQKITFDNLVKTMVVSDIDATRSQAKH